MKSWVDSGVHGVVTFPENAPPRGCLSRSGSSTRWRVVAWWKIVDLRLVDDARDVAAVLAHDLDRRAEDPDELSTGEAMRIGLGDRGTRDVDACRRTRV
jgi:hypothetical protein